MAEFGEQVVLRSQLIAVRVVTANGAEVNLPAHSERIAHGDDLRDHLELIAQIGIGRKGRIQRDAGKRAGKNIIVGDGAVCNFGELRFKKILMRQVQ